ncbi:MAG: hypothetical protein HY823_05440 [Acidobacteria bacterium]|nr:hypothetical protein [Acidobacteriota bacterium]
MNAPSPLAECLGPDALLCGYAPPSLRRWIAPDELSARAFSAGSLLVAGELPLLCAREACGPETLGLLREAGWDPASKILPFGGMDDFAREIRDEASRGLRIVNSFPLPPGLVPGQAYLVPPSLRSWLNDKANLGALVPAGLRPGREILSPEEVLSRPRDFQGKVLKICTPEGNGGGHGVLLPPESSESGKVEDLAREGVPVVVEAFLDFEETRCLNFLVGSEGPARFLGAPEQELEGPRYAGNWFRAEEEADPAWVEAGRAVCARAAALGYRGPVGMDAGRLAEGGFRIFDLNFRMNGSTASLLLFPALRLRHGASLALRTSFRGRLEPGRVFPELRDLSRRGLFILTGLAFDGDGLGPADFIASGFLPGRGREQIQQAREEVAARLGVPGIRSNSGWSRPGPGSRA